MTGKDLDRDLVEKVRRNAFVDQDEVERVLRRFHEGVLTRDAAERALRALHELDSTDWSEVSPTASEWTELLQAMRRQAQETRMHARVRFWLAVTTLALVFALASLALFLPVGDSDAGARATVTVAVLAAGTWSTFVMMRLFQQAETAAERLGEKQVAVHFLRVALATEDEVMRGELIASGTTMFLGHHAPPTLPLEPRDQPGRLSG